MVVMGLLKIFPATRRTLTVTFLKIIAQPSPPFTPPASFTRLLLVPPHRLLRNQVMADQVKLIGNSMSPFVLRAQFALSLKKVEYELLAEKFGEKSELLLKSNPVYKKMPVLLHNDKPICESLIIVQYIDEVWPTAGAGTILPVDAYDRALQRFWGVYIDDKWFPSFIGIAKAQTEEAKAEAIEGVPVGLKVLEEAFKKLSKGKSFFGGDNIGYLDIALGCYLGGLRAMEKMIGLKLLDEEKTPLLAGWAGRFSEHEAVREVMPETDKLVVEFSKARQAKQQTPIKENSP